MPHKSHNYPYQLLIIFEQDISNIFHRILLSYFVIDHHRPLEQIPSAFYILKIGLHRICILIFIEFLLLVLALS